MVLNRFCTFFPILLGLKLAKSVQEKDGVTYHRLDKTFATIKRPIPIKKIGQSLSHFAHSYVSPRRELTPTRMIKIPKMIPQVVELLRPKQ